MQVKKLVLALAAAAVASVSTAAFAVDLGTGVSADNQIFFTGATAQTPGIARSMARLCTSGGGTLLTLTDGLAVPVLKGWKCDATAGTLYTDLPGVTGPWLAFKNEGGSTGGINPLRTGATVAQLSTTNCTLVSGTTYSCTGTQAKPAHIGFADVSQKVFTAKNLLSAVVAGNPYTADIATGAGQGFGVVVSPALYTLMANDQSTATPSISKAQYASIMTQGSNLWSVLLPNGTAHVSSPLVIARRGTTSGTQASAELYFLNNPCSATPAPVTGSLNAILGTTRTAPSSSNGFIGSGGTSFGSGANQFIFGQEASSDAVLAEVTNTTYAIGVVSLENAQPASSWKYLAINGTPVGTAGAPDFQRANTVKGTYDFAYESFMFQNTKSSIGTPNLLGNIGDFVSAIKVDLGTGANLANDNGIYADPLSPNVDGGAETARYSRGGNECRTAQYNF